MSAMPVVTISETKANNPCHFNVQPW